MKLLLIIFYKCFYYVILYSISVNTGFFIYVKNKEIHILQNTMCISELMYASWTL